LPATTRPREIRLPAVTVSDRDAARTLDKITGAVREASENGTPVILTVDVPGAGQRQIAAIIPASELHEPGTCCCKHCPWDGDHGLS